MCRLIGFASPVPTTLTEQIGKDEVARFGDMSALHADGWGTAWLRPEAAHPQRLQLEGYRSIERAPRDPRFAELAERTPTVAQLVHLRWATEGLAVSLANTHPFSQDGITLAHNGSTASTSCVPVRSSSPCNVSSASSRPSRMKWSSRSHCAASSMTWLLTRIVVPRAARPREELPQVAPQDRVEGRLSARPAPTAPARPSSAAASETRAS